MKTLANKVKAFIATRTKDGAGELRQTAIAMELRNVRVK
jgi:hypothetical protein